MNPSEENQSLEHEELRSLHKTRKYLKGSLTRFRTFLDKFTESNLLQLKMRMDGLESILKEFKETQLKIELLDENESDTDEIETFENRYYGILQEALELVKKVESKQNTVSPNTQTQTIDSSRIDQNSEFHSNKFPSIELIKFYGDYDKWPQFRDLYVSVIHDDPKIQKVRKFYYLMGSLKGPAEKILSGIPITNENYDVAWKLLQDRFENVALTLKNHVKALFELPSISEQFTLRNLKDDFQFRFRAIEALGEPVSTWDTLLIHILTSKLDSRTDERWEETLISKKIKKPSLDNLLEFLSDRCNLAETIKIDLSENKSNLQSNKPNKFNQSKKFNKFNKTSNGGTKHQNFTVANLKCPCCDEQHFIYRCRKFKDLSVEGRLNEAKRLKLCTNCLRSNHQLSECTAQGCRVCSNNHNTMLHTDNNIVQGMNQNESVSCPSSIKANQPCQVLLATALVMVEGIRGESQYCKVLLDSGAQSNFITSKLCKKLKLPSNKVSMPVVGVGGTATNITEKVRVKIASTDKSFSTELSCLVITKITSKLPNFTFSREIMNIPSNIVLADPQFYTSTDIDMLIGAEWFYALLELEQIKLGDNLPILQKSRLGWLISGPLTFTPSGSTSCNLAIEDSLSALIEQFWKIEDLPQSKSYSTNKLECEEHFEKNTKRDETGRFIVRLPINKASGNFGNSLANAIKRLHSVERRFSKNELFKNKYIDFMREYEALGHMSKINIDENISNDSFYLPHHGVLNEASSTTKLRVVFDGSCKSSNGISLNDKLLIGPTLQEDLFSIILRFRQHNFAMTADIEKMYRQVVIATEERDFQRIVWRENINDHVQHYTLNTVTYGTASASFLAIRCLQQTGMDHKNSYPLASQMILRDFYVDDLISGASCIEEAQTLKHDLQSILSKYGFNLRKWVVSDDRILSNSNEGNISEYHITDNDLKKTLGVYWQSKSDTFKFIINEDDLSFDLVTKRKLLSAISKIFDPLGIIAPVTIRAKLMLQSLWHMKVDWDEEISPEMSNCWKQFASQLKFLSNIDIPRHVLLKSADNVELHVFSDSSLKAYGAAVYVKSYSNGHFKVSLLCSKTRVAPVKTVTLPRLELCGAVLGVQLHSKVISSLTIRINKSHFWTDSTIVLSWLKLPANSLKIFVSNRVSHIQQNTTLEQWHYVPSTDNPADILSRGLSPTGLAKQSIWWSGPSWLGQGPDNWPTLKISESKIPEQRTIKAALVATTNENSIFKRYSTLYRLLRIVALCLRFLKNCRISKPNRNTEKLSICEIDQATIRLLKLAQAESFSPELRKLQLKKPVSKKSRLYSLDPIMGPDNLIRVGGRLGKGKLSFSQKHQIILEPKHLLTNLIIMDEHKRLLHAGVQTMLNSLRQSYWILKGRLTIRSVLRKCLTCFRINPSRMIQKMADLPENRITQNRPFCVSGVDFAGPFYIKDGKLRNRKIIKAYLCIFICFCTKAVHLEAVRDLSAESFLNTLKRFISRRGLCKLLYSDNGSNFIGANHEIKVIYEWLNKHITDQTTKDYFLRNKIEWRFIPPRSPHHGGLWEAAIKRAKFHIHRIVGNLKLTFEDLSTIFCQIEAVLNSRPLIPISDDPDDLQALTPGHFLIGESLTSIPQFDLSHIPSNRLNQYQIIQNAMQQFWKRWSTEYLSTLQVRSKWLESTSSVKIGSLVLLVDENSPPLLWKMGRISQIHPSSDGLVRICAVKTSTGTFDRAVQKLCLLPIDDSI